MSMVIEEAKKVETEDRSLVDALQAFTEERMAVDDDDPEKYENAALIAAGVAPEKILAVRELLGVLARANLRSFLNTGRMDALTLGTLTIGIMFAKKGLV